MRKNEVVATYDYYTLEQAREIIEAERKQKATKLRRKQRRIEAYYRKQRFYGTGCILLGILTPVLSIDFFFSLVFISLGIACMFRTPLFYDYDMENIFKQER